MKFLLSIAVLVMVCNSSYGRLSMSGICALRAFLSGQVAYGPHDTDCDKFIQCSLSQNGGFEEQVRECAFSTYWNDTTWTCASAKDTYCPRDKCENQVNGYRYESETNCRGYWGCFGGKSVAMCCPQGKYYNSTVNDCVDNEVYDDCLVTCLNDVIVQENETNAENETTVAEPCEMYPVDGEPAKYKVLVEGHGFITMSCAAGTVLDVNECQCVAGAVVTEKPMAKCTREIYLPFDEDDVTRDMSGKNNHVTNEFVTIKNGTASFNGRNSRLVIPRFNNVDHTKNTVVIKVNYTSAHSTLGNVAQVIVSNSGHRSRCLNPSILLSEDSNRVYFGVGITNSSNPLVFTHVNQTDAPMTGMETEKSVVYKFDGLTLTGSENGNVTQIPATGDLQHVQCPLYVGFGIDMAPFEGEIDELEIYLCDPDMD